MPCKDETGIRRTHIFAVIITDRKLSIWPLFVWVIDYTDVTTSENRTFFWIISDCELNQIQRKLLLNIYTEYKTFQSFISCPLLLSWTPSHRCIPSYYLTKLSLQQHNCPWNTITFLMKFLNRKWVLWCSENQIGFRYFVLKEARNNTNFIYNFAIESSMHFYLC